MTKNESNTPEDQSIKSYSLDEVKDHLMGKRGTERRDLYEQQLQQELLADMTRPLHKS